MQKNVCLLFLSGALAGSKLLNPGRSLWPCLSSATGDGLEGNTAAGIKVRGWGGGDREARLMTESRARSTGLFHSAGVLVLSQGFPCMFYLLLIRSR